MTLNYFYALLLLILAIVLVVLLQFKFKKNIPFKKIGIGFLFVLFFFITTYIFNNYFQSGVDCGAIGTGGMFAGNNDPLNKGEKAFTCFQNAVQEGKFATVAMAESDVDTGGSDTLNYGKMLGVNIITDKSQWFSNAIGGASFSVCFRVNLGASTITINKCIGSNDFTIQQPPHAASAFDAVSK